jgi:cytochrome c
MAGMSILHCSMATRRVAWAAGLLVWAGLQPLPVRASAQLALDKGCYSCHGTPPRRTTPSMDLLATGYAKFRGQPDAAARLAAKLREGGLFSHIAAHERLSPDEAQRLMQWLIDGAK